MPDSTSPNDLSVRLYVESSLTDPPEPIAGATVKVVGSGEIIVCEEQTLSTGVHYQTYPVVNRDTSYTVTVSKDGFETLTRTIVVSWVEDPFSHRWGGTMVSAASPFEMDSALPGTVNVKMTAPELTDPPEGP